MPSAGVLTTSKVTGWPALIRSRRARSCGSASTPGTASIRPAIAAVDGERDVWAAYAEFNIPVLSNLDVQVAARADEYSDFGSAFSPKAGVRWKPLDWLALRASASRGFRAPSLSENSASTMISYGSVIDPYDPDLPNSRQSPTFFTVGNTNLEPEKTRSYNLGVVFTPTRDTALSIDWYQIKLDNLIGNALNHGAPPVDVSLRREGRQAVLDVADHGAGIAPERRREALRPFSRLDDARTRTGSVGLGLALAEAIARAHGGSLELRAADSGGLCVRVRLPLSETA